MTGTRSTGQVAPARTYADSTWDGFLISLSLVILTSVWRLQDLFPILATVQIPTLAQVAAWAFFIIDKDPRRKMKRLNHPSVKLAIAIFFLTIASVPGGVYPGLSFSFVLKDFSKTFLLLLLVASGLRDRKDIERLMWVNLAGAVLYSYMVITKIPVGADGRLGDLFYYDANDLGMLVVMTIPFLVFFVRAGNKPVVRIASGLSLGILMVALVKTGSRGGFLGLLAVTLFMVWRYRAISTKLRVTAVSAMAVLLLVFGSDRYWTMMSTMLHPTNDYNWAGKAESGRMEIWKRGIGYMVDHPITGVGANAFPAAEGMISDLAARQQVGIGLKWSAAHNSFVQIGAELGITGLLLFLAMLYQAAKSLRTPRRRGQPRASPTSPSEALSQTLASSLAAFCVAGFFLSQGYSAYLYTVIGMIASPARKEADQAASVPSPAALPVAAPRDHWRVGVPRFGATR